LSELKELSLQYNNLTELPKEIGQLKKLETLRLNNNQLTALPKEIGELENLKYLFIGFNRITELPEEIGNLKNLIIFDVGQNLLTSLPASLANMESLTELHLVRSGSSLDVPESLCNLRSLEYVAISSSVFVPNCWMTRRTGRFTLVIK
jgi:Leucine-rich repeat (LRR) protein